MATCVSCSPNPLVSLSSAANCPAFTSSPRCLPIISCSSKRKKKASAKSKTLPPAKPIKLNPPQNEDFLPDMAGGASTLTALQPLLDEEDTLSQQKQKLELQLAHIQKPRLNPTAQQNVDPLLRFTLASYEPSNTESVLQVCDSQVGLVNDIIGDDEKASNHDGPLMLDVAAHELEEEEEEDEEDDDDFEWVEINAEDVDENDDDEEERYVYSMTKEEEAKVLRRAKKDLARMEREKRASIKGVASYANLIGDLEDEEEDEEEEDDEEEEYEEDAVEYYSSDGSETDEEAEAALAQFEASARKKTVAENSETVAFMKDERSHTVIKKKLLMGHMQSEVEMEDALDEDDDERAFAASITMEAKAEDRRKSLPQSEEGERKQLKRSIPAVMRSFDKAKIFVKAGNGGNEVVAFRREKFVPFEGLSGGSGGRGGNIYVRADPSMNSLLSFRRSVRFRAGRGSHGMGESQDGAAGEDCTINVPLGTVIREAGDGISGPGKVLLEVTRTNQCELLLLGGRGGRGNTAFKTGRNKTPQLAENGEEGTEMSTLSGQEDEPGKLDELLHSAHSAYFVREGVLPVSCNVFLSLLQECTRKKDLAGGRHVYSLMQIFELDTVAILEDHLIRLFGCCGSLEEAEYTFNNAANPSVYTWHAIISAYTMHGHNYKALDLYDRMLQDNTAPDKYIYPCILKACCNLGAVGQGMVIHAQIVSSGLESEVFVGNALMDMYAKCNVLEAACTVFLGLPDRNVVSWNLMITMFVQHGEDLIALELYERMQTEGVTPNIATFSSVLKACGHAKVLDKAKAVHEQLIAHGLVSDVIIGSTLIDMYACFGMMDEALKEFNKLPKRSVVPWCTIIAASVQHGLGHLAMELYERMGLECVETDDVTFMCTIKACATVGDVGQGMVLHDQVVKQGLDVNMFIGNSLVSMYAKCGNMSEACATFDQLPTRNVVSWSAMIAGYSLNGNGISALRLFEKMKAEDVKPDKVTLMAVLDACAGIGALSQGKLVHQELIERGLNSDAGLGSTLINMYSKCGSLEDACIVFSSLPEQNVRLWGVLIAGYARNGNCLLALNCLKSMQGQGFQPDAMICTSVLAACRHAGQIKEGYQQFKSMRDRHGISPSIEHYGCMIDLLGRTGHLDEAEELLDVMPIQPDLTGWMSLLKACRSHGNMNLGKWCFDRVMRLDLNVSAGYVAMSGMYAEAQMWDDAYTLEQERKRTCVWKKPGRAWIEVNGKVHEFAVGDRSHPQMDNIRIKLQSMNYYMREDYKPQLHCVSHSRSSKSKQDALCGHCERLAIAFGFLNMPEGTPIRVTKNLQVCRDCHSASKMMSKIEARPIIISDTYRVHEFKNGECSCGDWF